MSWFALLSYTVAALAYAATSVILFSSLPRERQAVVLTLAVAASSVWAATIFVLLVNGEASIFVLVTLDALHLAIWITCARSWLASPVRLWLIMPLVGVSVWLVAVGSLVVPGVGQWVMYPALVALTLLGFLAVEQVYRNATQTQRPPLAWLCAAIGGVFAIDLFVYSQATLLRTWLPFFWEARGFANTMLLPLIMIAAKRQAKWERELFVSRQVVFYTASLLGVGGYLLMMALLGYVIRAMGGEWTFALAILFLTIAAAVLLFVLFSSTIRTRFRVLIVKHFYRHKYDYRDEWLRLTQRLGRGGDSRLLASDGIEALALIIGSPHGDLWISRDEERYEWMASSGTKVENRTFAYSKDHAIAAFLATRSWVIDSQEYAREPELYQTAFGDPNEGLLPEDAVIVPLDCQGRLQGFAVLKKPAGVGRLNFEDHDILKTAGRQVAVAIAQALALERLAETRQFEAINKMTTFLMHDLKNIIAQQQLVVSNAGRFRHRPEFIDDAIATIRSGVERMRHVLDQLQVPSTIEMRGSRSDGAKVLMEVRSQCADRQPIPHIEFPETVVWVGMDRNKLASILGHLIRNSQDATPPDGQVRVHLTAADGIAVFSIADSGCGMDEVFIRDRLFRPFDSTKGAQGMGIGAYQVRDIVRSAGGDVEVRSTVGAGTTFYVRLPLV